MNRKLQVVVMLGGPSAERAVSLNTGRAVAAALRSAGHHVTELDPQAAGWTLPPGTEAVFLALHGTYGEDGTIQRELDALGVPYTGCGPEASRIAFDKILTKERCAEAGVPTAPYAVVRSASAPLPSGLRLPLVVKPARQGSSVGLKFVSQPEEWAPALAEAIQFDDVLLVEERILGRETTVGILDGRPLPVVEVRPCSGAYDYQSKYTAGATEYLCPAEFDAATTARVQDAALGAFRAVGGRDYARVDVMVTAAGLPVVLEVNTLPGMTGTSLLPKAAAAAGISYVELCEQMLGLALNRAPVGPR
jgi:D-alanine-D-alanine ligase